MDIRIQITDSDYELKNMVERAIYQKLEILVLKKFQDIDFDSLINKRIDTLIDRSKYLSDGIIRNLVQQKIAREITNKILDK